MFHTEISTGFLLGSIIAVFLALAFVIAGIILAKTDSVRGEGRFWLLLTSAAVAITVIITGFTDFPFSAAYHEYVPVSGMVQSVESRLIASGTSGGGSTQVFPVQIGGQTYKCDDTRCAQLKAGSRVTLLCIKEWEFNGSPGYECNWGKLGLNTTTGASGQLRVKATVADKPLPGWFHWGGTSTKHGGKPCIIAWGGGKHPKHVLICKDGYASIRKSSAASSSPAPAMARTLALYKAVPRLHLPHWVHVCADTRNSECAQNGTHRKVYGRRLSTSHAQRIHLIHIGTVSCSNQVPYAFPVRHFNCTESGDAFYSLQNEATGKCLTYSNNSGNLNFDARCGITHPITWFVLRNGSRFQSVAFSQIEDGDLELTALGLNKRVILETYLGQHGQHWAFYTNAAAGASR